MSEFKIVGKYKNLRMSERKHAQREGGEIKELARLLISCLQIHFQIRDQRERESVREIQGRDEAVGSRLKLLSPVFS